MTTMLGVDASFDTLTPAKAQMLRANGIKVYGQCLWTVYQRPAPAIENLYAALAAGLIVTAYGSLSATGDGVYHARQTLAGVPQDIIDALVFCMADVELPGIANQSIGQFVNVMADHGLGRVIYTSAGQWTGAQHDTHEYADCLLVEARWDAVATLDHPSFGGWQRSLGRQYTQGVYVPNAGGIFACRDIYDRELMEGLMQIDAPTKGEFQALAGLVAAMKARQDALVPAFFDHVAHHPQDATAADVTDLKDRLDALTAKVDAAGAALSGGK